MAKRMPWREIQQTYPNQWVGLTDVECDCGGVSSAVVKYTDKSGDELIGMQIENPDNVPFIFSNWAVDN